jgi:glycosyltransferase involved in cell wall biosynthesis
MRILYCAIDQQVPGARGGSIHVRAVADGLAALGHEVHVATQPGPQGFPVSDAAAGGVRWHAIGAPFGRPHLRLAQVGRVKSLARTVTPDAVIERYHNFGGEGLLAAREVGAPSMLEVNAPIVDYPGSPKRRLDRLLLVEPMRRWRDWQCRAAARIVSPTRAILPDWIPEARVLEAEWGADTDRFRPGAPGPLPFTRDARTTIVFVGAFRAWHGVQHLVRAMRQLQERGRTGFRAILIGDGPELAPARALAAGLDAVTFTGALPHDQVAACLAASDIGAAPFDLAAHAPLSLTFYWSPLKVFEYLASGLPVVAPDIPRLRAIIAPGTAGLLYDAQDPAALASTLETLADASLRARLGAAARDRAVRHFSWASHCRLLDEALRGMVDERGAGTRTRTTAGTEADAAAGAGRAPATGRRGKQASAR